VDGAGLMQGELKEIASEPLAVSGVQMRTIRDCAGRRKSPGTNEAPNLQRNDMHMQVIVIEYSLEEENSLQSSEYLSKTNTIRTSCR